MKRLLLGCAVAVVASACTTPGVTDLEPWNRPFDAVPGKRDLGLFPLPLSYHGEPTMVGRVSFSPPTPRQTTYVKFALPVEMRNLSYRLETSRLETTGCPASSVAVSYMLSDLEALLRHSHRNTTVTPGRPFAVAAGERQVLVATIKSQAACTSISFYIGVSCGGAAGVYAEILAKAGDHSVVVWHARQVDLLDAYSVHVVDQGRDLRSYLKIAGNLGGRAIDDEIDADALPAPDKCLRPCAPGDSICRSGCYYGDPLFLTTDRKVRVFLAVPIEDFRLGDASLMAVFAYDTFTKTMSQIGEVTGNNATSATYDAIADELSVSTPLVGKNHVLQRVKATR